MLDTQSTHHLFATEYISGAQDIPISMEAFVAMSPLFGYQLVDRSGIRHGQDVALAQELGCFVPESELPCRLNDQFFYGSVDLMMARSTPEAPPQFYVVEVNGSNAAGLTDVALPEVERIVQSVALGLQYADLPNPSVILNSYTGEKNINVHERVALSEGIRTHYPNRKIRLVPATELENEGFALDPNAISIVIGPVSKILPQLSIRNEQLHLMEAPVGMIINDLTVDRITKSLPAFRNCLDRTLVLNRIHRITNLKARSYDVFKNRIVPALSNRFPLQAFDYWQADTRETLEELCLRLVEEEGRAIVIKPYSNSVGTGIAFLKPPMDASAIRGEIEKSITESEAFCKGMSDIFPYTLCTFVETALCNFPERELFNRKFDLRFFVVRAQGGLYAIPGVIKVASQEYDAAAFHREGLQTNTMRLTKKSARPMPEIFETLIQPLSSPASLKALGLDKQQVRQLSEMTAQVIGHLAEALDSGA